MTKEEINKTIAEYMGNKGDYNIDLGWYPYVDSLDALIPVVEKILKKNDYQLELVNYGEWGAFFYDLSAGIRRSVTNESDNSPSLALATACAKIIKELK